MLVQWAGDLGSIRSLKITENSLSALWKDSLWHLLMGS